MQVDKCTKHMLTLSRMLVQLHHTALSALFGVFTQASSARSICIPNAAHFSHTCDWNIIDVLNAAQADRQCCGAVQGRCGLP